MIFIIFSQAQLKTYLGHGDEVLDTRSTCDNSQIVSCGLDKTIILWDVSTGVPQRKWVWNLFFRNYRDCDILIQMRGETNTIFLYLSFVDLHTKLLLKYFLHRNVPFKAPVNANVLMEIYLEWTR